MDNNMNNNMKRRCKGVIHRIKKGDTLYRLSKMYGVRLIDIMKENPYVNVYNLQIGEEICIPTEVYEEEERRYYTTGANETIGGILRKLRVEVDDLFEFNQELYNLPVPENTIIRIP